MGIGLDPFRHRVVTPCEARSTLPLAARCLRLKRQYEDERSEPAGCQRYARRRKSPGGWISLGIGKGVGEVVGVLAVGDLDGYGAGEADELAGAGVGDDGDAELRGAAVHGAGVL